MHVCMCVCVCVCVCVCIVLHTQVYVQVRVKATNSSTHPPTHPHTHTHTHVKFEHRSLKPHTITSPMARAALISFKILLVSCALNSPPPLSPPLFESALGPCPAPLAAGEGGGLPTRPLGVTNPPARSPRTPPPRETASGCSRTTPEKKYLKPQCPSTNKL
jgi:hypothetical protein